MKPVSTRPHFVEMEQTTLRWWRERGMIGKYIHRNDASERRWSFIDGPITANNPMGVHHAWGRTLKDVFIRYKTRRGHSCRFQNGFDCQGLWVEVEVENIRDLQDALSAGPDWVMLDNMPPALMKECVRLCQGRAKTEASGGITMKTIVPAARTGVDAISLGCLTHSVPSVDLSLEITL